MNNMKTIEQGKALDSGGSGVDLHPLVRIPVGQYRCSKWYQFWKRGGWLTVERKDGKTSVMWTSGRDTHYHFCGCATAVDVDEGGNLTAYYESDLSMWMKWGYGRGTEADLRRGLGEGRWMISVLCDANDQGDPIRAGSGRRNTKDTL